MLKRVKQYWQIAVNYYQRYRKYYVVIAWLVAAIALFQVASIGYYGIIGLPLSLSRPWTVLSLTSVTYQYFTLSLGVTLLLFIIGFTLYQKFAWRGVQVLLTVLSVMTLWAAISGSLFDLFSQQTININPFHYVRILWLANDGERVAMAGGLAIIPAVLVLFFLLDSTYRKQVYGNARFANFNTIRKLGLYAKHGIYLAKKNTHNLIQPGYEHTILFAQTGSGKSNSVGVPNLLLWQGSVICTDIKLTLFRLTSGYRKQQGQAVYVFNPASEYTHRYNPLDLISHDAIKKVDDIQRLTFILIPPNPQVRDPFWDTQARQLLTAMIYYVLDHPKHPKTLGEINRLLKSYLSFDKWLMTVLETEKLHYIARNNFNNYMDCPEITHKSIKDHLTAYLGLFDNPYVEAATACSDFDIRDLRKKRMTIYLGVPENSVDRLSPLLKIFYEQVASVLTEQVPASDEPYDLLLLMDEFGRMPKMHTFLGITTFREYRIRVLIMIQELSQLYATYGHHDAKLFLNARVQIAYAPKDLDTSKYLESCIGTDTVKIHNQSRRVGFNLDYNESSQQIARPLMLAQEIRQLPNDKALVLMDGKTIHADKVPWYQDEYFKSLIIDPVIIPSIMANIDTLFKRAAALAEELQQEQLAKKAALDQTLIAEETEKNNKIKEKANKQQERIETKAAKEAEKLIKTREKALQKKQKAAIKEKEKITKAQAKAIPKKLLEPKNKEVIKDSDFSVE